MRFDRIFGHGSDIPGHAFDQSISRSSRSVVRTTDAEFGTILGKLTLTLTLLYSMRVCQRITMYGLPITTPSELVFGHHC